MKNLKCVDESYKMYVIEEDGKTFKTISCNYNI
jgi:hypothetical protein